MGFAIMIKLLSFIFKDKCLSFILFDMKKDKLFKLQSTMFKIQLKK